MTEARSLAKSIGRNAKALSAVFILLLNLVIEPASKADSLVDESGLCRKFDPRKHHKFELTRPNDLRELLNNFKMIASRHLLMSPDFYGSSNLKRTFGGTNIEYMPYDGGNWIIVSGLGKIFKGLGPKWGVNLMVTYNSSHGGRPRDIQGASAILELGYDLGFTIEFVEGMFGEHYTISKPNDPYYSIQAKTNPFWNSVVWYSFSQCSIHDTLGFLVGGDGHIVSFGNIERGQN